MKDTLIDDDMMRPIRNLLLCSAQTRTEKARFAVDSMQFPPQQHLWSVYPQCLLPMLVAVEVVRLWDSSSRPQTK
jgi:hypothetical protein